MFIVHYIHDVLYILLNSNLDKWRLIRLKESHFNKYN